MRLQRYSFAVPFATGIGLLHYFVLGCVWYYIAIHTPIPGLLRLTTLAASSRQEALFVCDILTNIVLAVLAAWALAALRPRNLPLYLVLAVVPSFARHARHARPGSGPRIPRRSAIGRA